MKDETKTSAGRQFLRQVGLLAAKDLKIYVLDRSALLFSLVFPFVFVLLFSLVMGGAFAPSDKAYTVYVATEEPTASLSQKIIDAMTGSTAKETAGGLAIRQVNPQQARVSLAEEKIGGYLLFPVDFTSRVVAGEPTTLTVRVNPEATTTRAALLSIAGTLASEFEAYQVRLRAIAELAGGAVPPEVYQALVPCPGSGSGGAGGGGAGSASGGNVAPVSFVFEKVGENQPPKAADLLVPGYLTMFVFFALALNAAALVQERENYTLERMVAGSATRFSIVIGKMAGAFVRGLVQIAIFWAAGVLLFHLRMGRHPFTVVAVSVLLTLAASAVGVFLASLARTSKSASSLAVFTSLSFAALGGSWWPLFVMPAWLQNLAKVTPHAWANSAFNKLMLFGASPASVRPEMITLGLFAVIFGALGVWRFKLN